MLQASQKCSFDIPITCILYTREWNMVESKALVHVTALIVVRSNHILFAD